MDGNERVSQFIHGITWQGLPAIVQQQVKLCLVDAIGALVSGTLTPVSQLAAEYAATAWQGQAASILLKGVKSTAAGAAFANGYAANGLDSDDVGKFTKGHPGAQIVPSALAVAEQLGKSGQEFLTAVAVGYEVAHRAGRCWHDHHETYQACGSWGSVANAAVAAHLLGLNQDQIRHALGIAEYHAPNLPMMRDIDDPTMVKHGIGWGAFTGITAAELARQGFTGIPSILGFDAYADWVMDIGERYIMAEPGGVLFKEYACCGWAHPVLDAARRLVSNNEIATDEIAHIQIEGFHETVRLGADLPTSTEEAQFNTAWPLAVLLLDGEVGPAQMLEDRLSDPRVRSLISKIELVESEELTELAHLMNAGDPRGKYLANVEITLRNGSTLQSGASSGGIDFGQVWDEARIERKLRWLASYVLSNERIDQLVELLWAFDQVPDVAALTDMLR